MDRLSAPVRVRVTVSRIHDASTLRVGSLTPDFATVVTDDALCGEPGARVLVTVLQHMTDGELQGVEQQFAQLRSQGIPVTVARDPGGSEVPRPADPDGA